MTGGALADLLAGNAGNDTLAGGGGADQLYDGSGSDQLFGGAGDDHFERGGDALGIDRFDGGAGFDTVSFNFHSTASVQVDLANSTLNGGMAKGLTLVAVEGVVGSDRDDDIRGAAASETLSGGLGDDRLDGRGGNDNLRGGGGSDLLFGGAGADRFVFGWDSRGSADVVSDFARGADLVVIERDGFGLSAEGGIDLVVGTDPAADGAEAQFLFETDTGRLWFDADGNHPDHEAVLVATLSGVHDLAASDFLLV